MIHREEHGDGRVVLRLDRPPVNALDRDTLEGLRAALRVDSGRAVVVAGTEGIFTGGIDMKAVAAADDVERRALAAGINGVVEALLAVDGPLVGALTGHAIGAGTIMALACDRVVAPPGPWRLGLTEAAAGVPFPAGALTLVARALGPPAARDLALSARILHPDEARVLGVVHELDPDPVARALALAAQLEALPSFRLVKAQLLAPLRAAVREAVAADPLLAGV